MNISSSFYVIGHPIGHSMSPFIHQKLFSKQQKKANYTAKDISPEQLDTQLPALLHKSGGINVTIPYKQAVIPYLSGLKGRAQLYRSVNTIYTSKDGYFGYNTDAEGFLSALRDGGIALKGKVALLGCGGAGRTFACEAALAGCSIINAVRKQSFVKAQKLQTFVTKLVPNVTYNLCSSSELTGDFDLLINATPVGMYPKNNNIPVSKTILSHAASVFDAVYNPCDTILLQCARANGALAVGGMPMLVWQAAAAHRIWYDAQFNASDINQLIEDAKSEMMNRFY